MKQNQIDLWILNRKDLKPSKTHLLSSDELERADKYVFKKDKARFVLSRVALRLLLQHYINKPAHLISLAYTPHEKPYLKGYAFNFNISHSEDCSVLAFSKNIPIGIDIEKKER